MTEPYIPPPVTGLDTSKMFLGADVDPIVALGVEGNARITEEDRVARIRRSFDLKLRSASELKDLWMGETLCIVGGAPSLEHTFDELVALAAAGAKIAAVNKTHDWLIERGIIPTFGVLADPRDWVAGYVTPHPDVKYLIASQCHDDTFARFEGVDDAYLWHAICADGDRAVLDEEAHRTGQQAFGVVGGSTTTLRLFDMGVLLLGFRALRWFAVDSSAADGNLHAYDKPRIDPLLEKPFALIEPVMGRELPRPYWTSQPMWHQFRQFEIILKERRQGMKEGRFPKTHIAFHGTGLLPDWAALRGLHANPNRAIEVIEWEPEQPKEQLGPAGNNLTLIPISELVEQLHAKH